MLMIHRLAASADPTVEEMPLELDLDGRKRSRHRLALPDGRELGWALNPGDMLHAGDRFAADDGSRFVVVAAAEPVLRITAAAAVSLTRAAYHLGNRHIPVEVGDGYLAIRPDPVLRDMLDQLGVQVVDASAAFEPESGAYGGGHRHGHDATFADDHALAQAVFRRHQPNLSPLRDPHDR